MNLPNEVFVTIEEAGTEDAFLHASGDVESFAEMGQKRVVGVYKLERLVTVAGTVTVTDN